MRRALRTPMHHIHGYRTPAEVHVGVLNSGAALTA